MKRGADLSVRDCNEMSPLHLLVQNKLDVLAIWLVHNGADIYQKDRKLFSPLDYGLPSTQRELRIAAGEILGSSTPGQKKEQGEVKAPQLYKNPSRPHLNASAVVAHRTIEVRVHVDNGSYKTCRVDSEANCGQLIAMATEKFNIPPQFAKNAILFESKQGVERSLRPGENVLNIRKQWPHIITSDGNGTAEQCFFIVCQATYNTYYVVLVFTLWLL